jgi:hypothetical protein
MDTSRASLEQRPFAATPSHRLGDEGVDLRHAPYGAVALSNSKAPPSLTYDAAAGIDHARPAFGEVLAAVQQERRNLSQQRHPPAISPCSAAKHSENATEQQCGVQS